MRFSLWPQYLPICLRFIMDTNLQISCRLSRRLGAMVWDPLGAVLWGRHLFETILVIKLSMQKRYTCFWLALTYVQRHDPDSKGWKPCQPRRVLNSIVPQGHFQNLCICSNNPIVQSFGFFVISSSPSEQAADRTRRYNLRVPTPTQQPYILNPGTDWYVRLHEPNRFG